MLNERIRVSSQPPGWRCLSTRRRRRMRCLAASFLYHLPFQALYARTRWAAVTTARSGKRDLKFAAALEDVADLLISHVHQGQFGTSGPWRIGLAGICARV